MDIVTSTDKNFVMPLGVMLQSLVINNPEENVKVYVIVDRSVTDIDKQNLSMIVRQRKGNDIVFYMIDGDQLKDFPELGKVNPHVSKAYYYRLFMTDFLPENLDKVLYLDGDMIIRHNLADLWNINIDGYAIAGVMDQCEASISNYNRMHYRPELGYFNAGMLLLNLKYWREHNAKKQFLEMIEMEPEKITFHDQDVLNYIFRDKKLRLPLKYNVQTSFYHKVKYVEFDYWKYVEELEAAIKDPVILHFSSGYKPWYKECEHPMRREFYKYKAMTVWGKQPLVSQPLHFKTKIKIFLQNIGFLSKDPYLFREQV